MAGYTGGRYLFTSESVTEGHPDKVCTKFPMPFWMPFWKRSGGGAYETVVTTGLVVVVGEISSTAHVDIPKIVRQTIRDIGYDRAKYGFDADTCGVMVALDEQSPDIGGVVRGSLEDTSGRPGHDVRLRWTRRPS